MLLLVISVLALGAGPVVYRLAGAARTSLVALDGFVIAAIGGIVLVHILPEAAAMAGYAALALAVVGFAGPSAIEHSLHRVAQRAHDATVLLACAGLALHALLDGVALSAPAASAHGGSVLGVAVVLHRIPLAITVWMLLAPVIGRTGAGVAMGSLAVATVIGFALGEQLLPYADATWVGLVQSLVGGSLLHVVIHRAPLPNGAAVSRLASMLGLALGLGLVAALAIVHDPFEAIEHGGMDRGVLVGLGALTLVFAALVVRRAVGVGGDTHHHH